MEKLMYDCLVIGAGPVGLAVTRALELCGLSCALCGQLPRQSPNSPDLRTAALFDGSLRLLHRLGAWPSIQSVAAPLAGIRIIDATGRLLRAPEQSFSAADIGIAQLGFNIPNPALVQALHAALNQPAQSPINKADLYLGRTITCIDPQTNAVAVTLDDGTIKHARMVIAADGRNSITRSAAGITIKQWDHNQSALTAHIDHTLPNNGISTEIHSKTGPCTVVPLGAHRSSLVWMDCPDRNQDRAAQGDLEFSAELEERLGGLLGPVLAVTPRRVFPLSTMIASRFAANRIALVGESAHAFPPIGAQGLNLGLRDVAALADHLANAMKNGLDPGADNILTAYSDSRRTDIAARTYGVDAFNVSLSSAPAALVRGALLHATKAAPAFKRFLITRGMAPIGTWPSLMRP
jgi:2-octaprenyl-6-methoxyphenol hydroxylase